MELTDDEMDQVAGGTPVTRGQKIYSLGRIRSRLLDEIAKKCIIPA